MKLNLTKPLVVFDLETTGLDLVNDRVIQLSYIKVSPDGKEERENLFVNPEKNALDYFYEQKEKGRIRHLGFSSLADYEKMKTEIESAIKNRELLTLDNFKSLVYSYKKSY